MRFCTGVNCSNKKIILKNRICRSFFYSALFFVSIIFPAPVFSQSLTDSLSLSRSNESLTFWSDLPNEQLAREITDKMTDVELYSQILMFGWAGAEPPELLYQWISRGLGSVKVFGWNTDNIKLVAKSVSSLQKGLTMLHG